jgi:para-nitrobenzyl esterase
VQTTNGPITGFLDGNVKVYKNVPYGADTATIRFQPPKTPTPWTAPLNCSAYGNVAPQPWNQKIAGRVQSEDCLNLNVWTPGLDASAKRSVLVWFHGGGYEHMTSNDDMYDGAKLARKRDVVVVTVNHRLNGFGYMYLGGVSPEFKTGNVGQLDLVLALQWVRDNIEKFGGDKGSVTIFGQSGGGAKCATLMAMPAARGLFHRVWTMSGQQITGRTMEHAVKTAEEVLAKVNGTSATEKLGRLLKMTMEEIRKAMGGGGQKWTPLVDGVSLPLDPFYPTANEQSKDIPMVIGNTYDETRNLIGSKGGLFNLTWGEVSPALDRNVRQFLGDLSTHDIVDQYRKQYPKYSPSDVFFAASTAARSWKSMLVESDIRAKQPNSPLWVYYLRWKSPFEGGRWGAAHAYDIPFVFANSDSLKQTRGMAGADELGEVMSKALVHFARTGQPAIEGSDLAWPRYELKERRSMIFDTKLEVHSDDRGWERKFFENAPYVQPGT